MILLTSGRVFVSPQRVEAPPSDHQESRSVQKSCCCTKTEEPIRFLRPSFGTLCLQPEFTGDTSEDFFWFLFLVFRAGLWGEVCLMWEDRDAALSLQEENTQNPFELSDVFSLSVFFFLRLVSVINFISEGIPRRAISLHIPVTSSCGCGLFGQKVFGLFL